MKTISAHLNRKNDAIDHLRTTKKSHKNPRYYEYYNHAAGDINRNATVTQAEYQRDACEEELYRLRYGIEKLLANSEQGDFGEQTRQRRGYAQNPFRTMMSRRTDSINRKDKSWFERCTPCCRRWRKDRCDDYANMTDDYAYHRSYNDRNYELPPRRTPKSPSRIQRYSDSFVSASPSPSTSSRYMDSNISHRKDDLRRMSKDIDDPVYQSLILKILEAKAMDCLCTGYAKENTKKQISHALTELNQGRTDEHQWDSTSVASSRLSSSSYDSSSSSPSISSRITNDESISSRSITSRLDSPTPFSNPTPSPYQSTPSSDKIKNSLKLNEENRSLTAKSNVTNAADITPTSSKSKPKKKSTKKRSKARKSKKKRTSSKSKRKHHSSKSPSRSITHKKHRSKHKKKHRKKRTKPKSNK